MAASTGIFLDTRYKKQDGTYPVKLRVTYNRESRLYNTKYSLSKEDFKKVVGEKPRHSYKDIKLELSAIEKRAQKEIQNLRSFSFDMFKRKFLAKPGEFANLYNVMKNHIAELRESGSPGTADTYQCAYNSLKLFHPSDKLLFRDVTPAFLRKYDNWMLFDGKSLTTISIYVRCIRHLYNQAIRMGDAKHEEYPFGRSEEGLYSVPQPQSIKRALTLDEIQKIFTYKAEVGSTEEYNRDLWVFSYLCNGMNMKDIFLLKYSNIHGEFIHYRRAKTGTTNRSSKPIDTFLAEEARAIIERWGNSPSNPENFIFPILTEGLTEDQKQKKVKQATKQCNKYIKRIAMETGIEGNVSTYTARHSFATVMKRSGASVEFISEQLGHSNTKTTEIYLASFEDEKKKEMAEKLTKFD